MMDLQTHIKKIRRLLYTRVENYADFTKIHQLLKDNLPNQFSIRTGAISKEGGYLSERFETIISLNPGKPTLATGEIPAQDVRVIIEVFEKLEDDSLIGSLERIYNVQSLFQAPNEKQQPKKTETKTPRSSRFPIPYVLLFCNSIGEGDRSRPDFFIHLYELMAQFPTTHLPHEIIVKGQRVHFINPRLERPDYCEQDMGWSCLPRRKFHTRCGICNQKTLRRHFFYDWLCVHCGDINYQKRVETANLTGRIAIVTGGRIRIGYATALRLLRSGARVVVLTRFPTDAAIRYSKETDFLGWSERLAIHGLDFRDLTGVQKFPEIFLQNYPHLDILINNAAQTVRHPPAYYAHLLPVERQPIEALPENVRPLLQHASIKLRSHNQFNLDPPTTLFDPFQHQIRSSAELSQIPLIEGDENYDPSVFPPGQRDDAGEQLDLRTSNTWVQDLENVNLAEMLEVQIINQIVPTFFSSKLKPLFERSPAKDKYIINVSSQEGKFSLSKDGRHPHTCIAKSALNMLTHSIAGIYAMSGIYVNSVDPGWISEQFPYSQKKRRFVIDIHDSAARICDPIFQGINKEVFWRGLFFKNFNAARW